MKDTPIPSGQNALYHKKLIPIEEGMVQDLPCPGEPPGPYGKTCSLSKLF